MRFFQENGAQTKLANFSCDLCGKTFKHVRMLNRHRRNHLPFKKYKCNFCGKGFNDSFDLKRHVRTHTGIVSSAQLAKTLRNLYEAYFNEKLRSEAIQVHAMRQELYAAMLAGKPPGQDSRHEAFARLQAKTRQDLRLRRLWFLYWRCSVRFFLNFFKEN